MSAPVDNLSSADSHGELPASSPGELIQKTFGPDCHQLATNCVSNGDHLMTRHHVVAPPRRPPYCFLSFLKVLFSHSYFLDTVQMEAAGIFSFSSSLMS